MPFQWYLFFKDAYVLLNPLWPCLSCAKMRRQSFKMSGTTMGVYKSPLSTNFCFKMLFSIMYVFWSKFLFFHCFLSCFVCGSLSCNLTSCRLLEGGGCLCLFLLDPYVECLCCLFHILSLLLLHVLLPVVALQKGSIRTLCLPLLVGG